jgi:hypothetical protein
MPDNSEELGRANLTYVWNGLQEIEGLKSASVFNEQLARVRHQLGGYLELLQICPRDCLGTIIAEPTKRNPFWRRPRGINSNARFQKQ